MIFTSDHGALRGADRPALVGDVDAGDARAFGERQDLGMEPMLLIVPAALGASCAFMLPVATPPNAVVFGSQRVTIPQMARVGLVLNFVGREHSAKLADQTEMHFQLDGARITKVLHNEPKTHHWIAASGLCCGLTLVEALTS